MGLLKPQRSRGGQAELRADLAAAGVTPTTLDPALDPAQTPQTREVVGGDMHNPGWGIERPGDPLTAMTPEEALAYFGDRGGEGRAYTQAFVFGPDGSYKTSGDPNGQWYAADGTPIDRPVDDALREQMRAELMTPGTPSWGKPDGAPGTLGGVVGLGQWGAPPQAQTGWFGSRPERPSTGLFGNGMGTDRPSSGIFGNGGGQSSYGGSPMGMYGGNPTPYQTGRPSATPYGMNRQSPTPYGGGGWSTLGAFGFGRR